MTRRSPGPLESLSEVSSEVTSLPTSLDYSTSALREETNPLLLPLVSLPSVTASDA